MYGVLILKDELEAIDTVFDKLSPSNLEEQLIECGLGVIHDCTESGWVMVGAKNTEQQVQPDNGGKCFYPKAFIVCNWFESGLCKSPDGICRSI